MVKQQSGFTLIELIAVMVILGILAATAIPKFVNLSDAARESAISNIAGTLESASALNHAVNLANDAGLTTDPVITVTTCANIVNLLDGNSLPAGYSISSGATAIGAAEGDSADCQIENDDDTSITASARIINVQ